MNRMQAPAVVGVALVLLAGCAIPIRPTTVSTPAVGRPKWVAYYVRGTAEGADVTYRTGSGSSQASVDLPLRNKNGDEGIQMTTADAPGFLYISAQNSGESGDVTCQIVIDGTVVAENTASGAFKIATCEYSQ